MPFGYDTTTGWNPATYADLLADIQAKYAAQTSANVDVVNGPAADFIRTLAYVAKDAYDDLLGAYNAGHITAAPGSGGVAEGSALEVLLTPKIGPKLAAAKSTVILPCVGVAGTVIPIGTTVSIEGETVGWTLDAAVEIEGDGNVDGEFTYAVTGPKTVVAGSSWTIGNAVTGWASVGPNAADAITGRDTETDAEYRERYEDSLRNNLIAEVRKVKGVSSASLIEWDRGDPDDHWGIGHWFEVLVVGGSDDLVGAAIHRARAKGTRSIGTTSVAVADSDYVSGEKIEQFSRPAAVVCYLTVAIIKGEGYSSDTSTEAVAGRETAIKAAVVAHFAALNPGDDTSAFQNAVAIASKSGVPGIVGATVLVDTVSPPVNVGVLEADIRDQLTITADAITVTGA